MILLFFILITIQEEIKTLTLRVIPKILYFIEDDEEIYIKEIKTLTNNLSELKLTIGNYNIKTIIKSISEEKHIEWVEILNDKEWNYSIPNNQIKETSIDLMEMMLNTMEKPKLELVPFHRTKLEKNSIIHQIIIIINLLNQKSMHFIEYKDLPIGKPRFIDHNVIVKDGEEI